MACKEKMTQLEMLNSFFCERLMAVAAEIFQAVKDTLCEYQDEINRSQQENFHLRKMLAEVSLSSGADAPNKKPDGSPPEREESYQGPPDSDLETSVIQVKLELSSVPQDPEAEQLPTASTCDSVLATRGQGPPHVFSGLILERNHITANSVARPLVTKVM
ncbi:uncharacterized protein LOC113579163 isoform X3 [Electrophorus electricus]|uniref:uncharacterized protein LOC113579163 isoform X3 n=1 Tax=Electrophorus electricus TaxID=8005 RepID=UPI0015D0ACD6|nr:uncharacterized protein LOC113579163 isoform X3 [Electrophorus electricus]